MHYTTIRRNIVRLITHFAKQHFSQLGLLASLAVGGLAVAPAAQAGAINFFTCNGKPATILATAGDDTIAGTRGDDVIMAFTGNDTIFGGMGNDFLQGNKGSDKLYGSFSMTDGPLVQGGDDMLYGGPGNDYLDGWNSTRVVYADGGDDRDVIYGSPNDDVLHGGAGDDYIDALWGHNTLYGESGDDYLESDTSPSFLNGGTNTAVGDECEEDPGSTYIGCERLE